jgi:chemotaxis protein MotB
LIVFVLLCLTLTLYTLARTAEERERLANLHEERRALEEKAKWLEGQVEQFRQEISDRASTLRTREQQLEKAEVMRAQLEEQRKQKLMAEQERAALLAAVRERMKLLDIEEQSTVMMKAGEITIRLADRLLFESAQAELQAGGRVLLLEIAKLLNNELAYYDVRVTGYTDDVPIGESLRLRFGSNWDLSASRASAAVVFLEKEGGVDAARLMAVGRGETRPLVPNDSLENRARNRRIEIVIDLESGPNSEKEKPPRADPLP